MSCFLYAKHIIIHLKARYNIMKIREFCKRKNITQEKLAEDLNVDVRTIRRWESSTPSTRIILKLANYFEVFPHNLLQDNEKMPEFPIGQSGAIDFKFIKKEVLISINILSSKNVIHDIYRHTFIKYNDSMLEDFLNLSLEITNIYSRLVFLLNSKEWLNQLHYRINYSCFDYELQLKLLANDLFYPDKGLFNNSEINNLAEKVCNTCNKYKFNPLYGIYLPSDIEGFLINAFLSYKSDTASQLHQTIVCEHILLGLLNYVGNKIHNYYAA